VGCFRMALAIAVLISHLPGSTVVSRESLFVFIWSGHAVFAFFIISGFYIAMVVNEKYSSLEKGTRRFYLNRALRLYPAYWVVLILYAIVFHFSGTPSFLLGETYGKEFLWLITIASNTLFFGAELIQFTDNSDPDFVLGPVWSLSMEAYFYLLAPLFVTRSIRFVFVLTLLFIVLRLGMYWLGVEQLPWRYFFFPSVFCFFCLGVLSYRIYQLIIYIPFIRFLGLLSAAVLVCITTYEPFWMTAGPLDCWQSWLFFLIVFLCTPFLFHLSKDSSIDSWVGQLAYPLFIGHMLVIVIFKASDAYLSGIDAGVFILIGSLLLAQVLYLTIDKPVEKSRRRIARESSPVGEWFFRQ
jgi:peptidoglycan/LPS O-acetylase OafA/YrhL